jgi:hypothetical protein
MALAHSEKYRDTSGLANCHGGLFRFVFTTSFARYAVEEFKLKWTRAKSLQTLKIHGNIEKFPMMRNAGEEGPARLTLYIDKETDRVVAVDVTPFDRGEPDPKKGERIKLGQFQVRNGLNVPHRLSYLWRDKDGALRSHSKVNILHLDLDPGLKQKDLERQ